MRFKTKSKNRRLADALTMVTAAAEQAVAAGLYPTVELALFEMAANQRKATTQRVDIHELLERR